MRNFWPSHLYRYPTLLRLPALTPPMAPLRLSLRGHKAPISCIARYDDNLVSADRDGWIILWNLRTKRPYAVWKAHEGHILTLKQTAMGLLSHGRDSNIRLWSLNSASIGNCSKETSIIASKTTPPTPHFEEVPVNSLNFCNVEFWNLGSLSSDATSGLVATPATVDSDNFDVYKVTNTKGDFSIQRIVENFSVGNAEIQKGAVEEVNSPELSLQLRGHGIIMRLLFVAENLLFVGYESGAIFAFKLEQKVIDNVSGKNRTIVNNDVKVQLVMALLGHTPLPVLSLEYDSKRQILYSGSASKKLLCLDVSKLVKTAGTIAVTTGQGKDVESKFDEFKFNDKDVHKMANSAVSVAPKLNKWGLPEKASSTEKVTETLSENSSTSALQLLTSPKQTFNNLKHYGIQNIQVFEMGYVAAFWDGVIKAYNHNSEQIFELERAEEAIKPSQLNELSGSAKKSLCIYAWNAGPSQQVSHIAETARRLLIHESLLFVGYTDGLIRAYAFL